MLIYIAHERETSDALYIAFYTYCIIVYRCIYALYIYCILPLAFGMALSYLS